MPFATLDRATGRVVGSTRFLAIEPRNRRLEIGYAWIAGPWQRSHVNTEPRLVLRHAFEDRGGMRIELKTDSLNEQSRRASLASAPWRRGFREHMISQGGRRGTRPTRRLSRGSGRRCWIAWREPGDPAVRFGISPRGQQSKCAVFPISRKAISAYYSLLAASAPTGSA